MKVFLLNKIVIFKNNYQPVLFLQWKYQKNGTSKTITAVAIDVNYFIVKREMFLSFFTFTIFGNGSEP